VHTHDPSSALEGVMDSGSVEEIDVEDAAEDTARSGVPIDVIDERTRTRGASRSVGRDRNSTVPSPISAQLAESMRPPPAHAAPPAERAAVPSAAMTAVEADDPGARFEELVERARACMEAGDLAGAVLAADRAVAEGKKFALRTPMATAAVFSRIFAAYLGLLGQVPALARPAAEIAGASLDEGARALLGRVDGIITLEEVCRTSRILPRDGLRIATRLMHEGLIRMI
jgi:hypothetical protein